MSESLAKASGFVLPGALMQPSAPVISTLQYAPYITFAHHSRKDEWAKLQAKFGVNTQEGDMYLINGAEMFALERFKCGYICGTQYWVNRAPNGDLLAFSREPQPEPFREHVETVLLAYHNDSIIPVNCTFRTTKCGAAKTMDETLRLASTADWGKMSPQHLQTMPIPQPFFRFFAEVFMGPVRNSKKSGLPYKPLFANVGPVGPAEIAMIRDMTDNEEAQKQLNRCADRYKDIFDELQTKCID